MKFHTLIKTILTTLLLTLFISACSNKSDSILKEKVINANTATLSFIAPIVQEKEHLVFEVEASTLGNDTLQKERATVTVHPLEVLSDDNETTPTDTNITVPNDNNITTPTDTNTTIPNDNNITTPTNPLKSISLTISKNSLNINENTTLNAIATYGDKTTKDITDEVEWISTDLNAIQINKRQLKAKKETNIILQAKFHAITSNAITLEIYQEINGHRLPPEPNKTLNDSTLLGIDSNNNGVRDDVERWIYKKYENKHPVHIDIAMQAARGYKQVLETPEKAKEIHKKVDAAIYCEIHYRTYYKYCDDMQLVTEDRISSDYFIRKIYFNTVDRESKYLQFDKLLSGGSYTTPKPCEGKNFCDFNTSKYEE